MKPIIRTLFFTVALALPQAHAGLISSDDAQVSGDRERLKALIARPELAQQIEKLGILPREAVARVDAMNDAEVRNLAGRLDALPAGGELSTNTLVLIVLILLLVILL
jgi:hypothetical protein